MAEKTKQKMTRAKKPRTKKIRRNRSLEDIELVDIDSLSVFVDLLVQSHMFINVDSYGANAYTLIKTDKGREIVGESLGFKIFDFNVTTRANSSNLIIEQLGVGYKSGNRKHRLSYRLYLNDVIAANAYNHSAYFKTSSGLDFFYTENHYLADMEAIFAWAHKEMNIIRFQWRATEEEDVLEEMGDYRLLLSTKSLPSRRLLNI